MTNKNSPLFINFDEYYKPHTEVIKMIRRAGGLAFLAHPAEYRVNMATILEIMKDCVDGIECFHPSATIAQRDYLVKFAQDHGLLISGGSDFHGTPKPTIDLGTGEGDLVIPSELLAWVNCIKKL